MDAPARQRRHRGPVADVFAASDERIGSDADVGEADVGRPCAFLAHLGVLGAHLDAGGVCGNQEHRDPRALVVSGPGAREYHEQVRDGCVRYEAFLAGDHPIVIDSTGFGPQTGGVGSGAGFGQRERGDDVAGRDRLQPAGFLFVGAEPDQNLSRDAVVGAEHRTQCQGRVAQLHRQLDVLHEVEPKAAPLLGNGVAEQSHLLGFVTQVVGDAVLVEDLLLAGDHGGSDELPCLSKDLAEIVVGDFRELGGGHRLHAPLRIGAPRSRAGSYIKYDICFKGARW